jgi:flavin-dependent dehydrogenase
VTRAIDVGIVGGGPAGSVLAALVARRGHSVAVYERSPAYRWRACGVFTSPATTRELATAGVASDDLDRLARPIPAMRVEVPGSRPFRLTYGDDGSLAAAAVGFDRASLDVELLELARSAGADVHVGASVASVKPGRIVVREVGGEHVVPCRIVVGADGIRSIVARSVGVARPARLEPRIGLTFHVVDPRPDERRDARMVVLDDGYVGLAPVPGGRVNVGIVLGRRRARRLRRDGAEAIVADVLAAVPPASDDPVTWAAAERCDPVEGAAPIGHRVTRRAGSGWLLVGDAAGFLDPFTGEGLHRAIVSARLAAVAIDRALRNWRAGEPVGDDDESFAAYDRAMAARFRAKDVASLVVQAFLARPSVLAYAARRFEARDSVRETMGLVMGDLVPATRAIDPRFLAALLRP